MQFSGWSWTAANRSPSSRSCSLPFRRSSWKDDFARSFPRASF